MRNHQMRCNDHMQYFIYNDFTKCFKTNALHQMGYNAGTKQTYLLAAFASTRLLFVEPLRFGIFALTTQNA